MHFSSCPLGLLCSPPTSVSCSEGTILSYHRCVSYRYSGQSLQRSRPLLESTLYPSFFEQLVTFSSPHLLYYHFVLFFIIHNASSKSLGYDCAADFLVHLKCRPSYPQQYVAQFLEGIMTMRILTFLELQLLAINSLISREHFNGPGSNKVPALARTVLAGITSYGKAGNSNTSITITSGGLSSNSTPTGATEAIPITIESSHSTVTSLNITSTSSHSSPGSGNSITTSLSTTLSSDTELTTTIIPAQARKSQQ